MIRITPGSPAAALVASIKAQRQASQPSGHVRPTKGLTTELPARFRRPLVMRHAHPGECCERLASAR
jgi:hypothetical protein